MIYLLAWVLLSFTNAMKEILVKHTLKWVDSTLLIGLISFFISLILLPFVIIEWIPQLSVTFWIAFFIWGLLYFIWKYFFFKSLQQWDISFIAPLKWLVTINVVLSSWLLLWELPNLIGLSGILLIVWWVYLLAIQKHHVWFFDPIRHIFTHRGSRLYLITSLCYGFTVTIDKIGVLETSPIFWVFAMNIFLTGASALHICKNVKASKEIISKNYHVFFWIVVVSTCIVVWQMYIIEQILASYTSAFKASSSLFAVLIWGMFFWEKDLRQKFVAALVILAWVMCIILS